MKRCESCFLALFSFSIIVLMLSRKSSFTVISFFVSSGAVTEQLHRELQQLTASKDRL